jgi:DNA-binding GntR family transcriptional regulator
VDPSPTHKRAKGESLSLITDALRIDIISGKLRPGDRIHQEAIAERFGTSRSPAREALKMLQSEGLVVVLPNLGARVPKLDAGELDEVYWLREHVEPAALARSAVYLTEEQFAAMQASIDALDREEERGAPDPAAILRIDRHFHLTALSANASERLLQVIRGLWNIAEHYRIAYFQLLGAEARQTSQVEHRLILDALRRGSPEDAAALLRVHIRRTRIGLAANSQIFD